MQAVCVECEVWYENDLHENASELEVNMFSLFEIAYKSCFVHPKSHPEPHTIFQFIT